MSNNANESDNSDYMEVIDLTADLDGSYDEIISEASLPSGDAVRTSSSEDLFVDNPVINETNHGDFEQTEADAVVSSGTSDEMPEAAAADAEDDSGISDSDNELAQEAAEFLGHPYSDAYVDSDAESDFEWEQGCMETCKVRWEKIHDKSQLRKCRIGESRELIAGFRAKIDQMKAENRRLRIDLAAARARSSVSSAPRRTEAMWPLYIKWFLRGEWARLPSGMSCYEDIYKLSCREMNIPPHPRRVLPGLVLREPDPSLDYAIESVAVTGSVDFERLPLIVQFRVLRMLLCFYKKKVHVLTRLDPWKKPSLSSGVLGNDPEHPQPLRRFHIGDSSVSLTYAILPKDLLAPLGVCKKWLFWGMHLFYGENTFAFSSLGE